MIILIVAGLLLSLFFKPTRRSLLAFLGLLGLDLAGVSVGVNVLNACLVGFLGIPGIGIVAFLNIFY